MLVQEIDTNWWSRTLFFLLSSSINHLTTPQTHLVTLCRGATLRLGSTGPQYQTAYTAAANTCVLGRFTLAVNLKQEDQEYRVLSISNE